MPKYFKSGSRVPATGIYNALHADHRLVHQVTIMRGDIFPVCKKCAREVRFELVEQVTDGHSYATKPFTELLVSHRKRKSRSPGRTGEPLAA